MELIVDKGFLDSFFKYNSHERYKPIFEDFIRFIRKLQPGFTLITNFKSNEELAEAVHENPLLELITEKMKSTVFLPELVQRIRQADYYEQGMSIKFFLVDCSTKDCDTLEGLYGCSFICGENFNWKWKPYKTDRDDATRYITSNTDFDNNLRFDSWTKLTEYKHPVNAVLIVDNYILCDKSNQHIEHNIKPLLLNLLPKKKTEIPVDITIIAEVEPSNTSFADVQKNIEQYIKINLPNLNFNLSIIKYNRNILYKLADKGYRIHDRRIFTNYFWVETGHGFNIINDKKQVDNTDSTISFKFNLFGPNYSGVQHFLKGYAAYAGIAQDEHTYGSKKPNRLLAQYLKE